MSSHPSEGVVRVGRDPAPGAAPVRASVAVGFGSPADDSGVTRLDLNEVLIRHAQATFMMRVAGTAMRASGLDDGDLLLVDRAITPAHGHVVIGVVDAEFLCRRLFKHRAELRLQADDPLCADIVPHEGQELSVWGVVTQVIKTLPA